MGRQARWEYLCRIWPRYREADRAEKGRILDEVCRVTGYHRKYAVRRLKGPAPERRPPRGRLRGPSYGKSVDHALRLVQSTRLDVRETASTTMKVSLPSG